MRPSELRLFVLCVAWLFTVLLLVLSWPLVAGADELQVYPDPTPQRTDGSPWSLLLVAGVCLAVFVVWKVVRCCDDSEEETPVVDSHVVRPGDGVILTPRSPVTPEMAAQIRSQWVQAFPSTQVIVVDGEVVVVKSRRCDDTEEET